MGPHFCWLWIHGEAALHVQQPSLSLEATPPTIEGWCSGTLKGLHDIQFDGILTTMVSTTPTVPSTTKWSKRMLTFTFLLCMLRVMGIPMMGPLLSILILLALLNIMAQKRKNLLEYRHHYPYAILIIIITLLSLSILMSLFLVFISMITTIVTTPITKSTCRRHYYGSKQDNVRTLRSQA